MQADLPSSNSKPNRHNRLSDWFFLYQFSEFRKHREYLNLPLRKQKGMKLIPMNVFDVNGLNKYIYNVLKTNTQ